MHRLKVQHLTVAGVIAMLVRKRQSLHGHASVKLMLCRSSGLCRPIGCLCSPLAVFAANPGSHWLQSHEPLGVSWHVDSAQREGSAPARCSGLCSRQSAGSAGLLLRGDNAWHQTGPGTGQP